MNWEVNPRDIFINEQNIWIPQAVYDLDQSSGFLFNDHHRGIKAILEVIAVPTVHTLQVTIVFRKPSSGDAQPIATGPLITTTGTYVLTVYPGITEVANEAVSAVLPQIFAIAVAHGTFFQNFTYSLSGYLMQ